MPRELARLEVRMRHVVLRIAPLAMLLQIALGTGPAYAQTQQLFEDDGVSEKFRTKSEFSDGRN